MDKTIVFSEAERNILREFLAYHLGDAETKTFIRKDVDLLKSILNKIRE